MKTITPISIWKSGKNIDATILNSHVISDNLSTRATFYYSLLSENKEMLTEGNLYMTGADYDAYETNQYAWDWIAAQPQLNVTITGDYVEQEITPTEREPFRGISLP
jgi:hypothetical protein